ncbi:MAG: DNA internalization-related competence protein ComEC/Rec2, partial [Gemmatimonadales bacterium]
ARLFGDRAPLVDALVIGRRAELASDVRERYTRSGLAHLLSISGLHVGFLAAWIAVLLRLARLGPAARFWASAALVLGYVWLLGFPAPATRAAWMLQIDGVARLRQRVVTPRGTIGVAVLAVLVVDPWAVRSIGAWLSVAAVAAVIWASRSTVRSPALVRVLAPAVAATLLTAPIAAFGFGTVAPIGVAANLVAIPLGAVAVPGLIIALLLSWVWSAGAELLAAGAGLTLALLDLVAGAAARVPGGHVITAPGWPAAGLWGAIAWVAWWLWRSPRRPWLIAARLAFVATLCLSTSLLDALSLDACRCLEVHFLDVGQGDAAVLRTPAGRWIVIDGGPRTAERDAGRRVVVPFLRRHGVERVALVVATHGHADHVGGLPALLAAFPPTAVLEPGEPVGEAPYLEFLAAVEASGASWRPARAGDRLELDGVALQVLSPDSAWAAWTLDPNEESVVLLVQYGGRRLVFTGDAGLPVEERLAGRIGDVDVLKVGHHGSRSATSDSWLAELRPEVAVVSVGARNRYGHPAPDVLARLATRRVQVLRTDQAGTITLRIDSARAYTDLRHHD